MRSKNINLEPLVGKEEMKNLLIEDLKLDSEEVEADMMVEIEVDIEEEVVDRTLGTIMIIEEEEHIVKIEGKKEEIMMTGKEIHMTDHQECNPGLNQGEDIIKTMSKGVIEMITTGHLIEVVEKVTEDLEELEEDLEVIEEEIEDIKDKEEKVVEVESITEKEDIDRVCASLFNFKL